MQGRHPAVHEARVSEDGQCVGVGGGIRPVKYLVKKIVLLLKEYLCSCDVQEATRLVL